MRRAIQTVAWVAMVLLTAACHEAPVLRASVGLTPDYRRELLSWTAHGTLYDRLERRVELYAVLLTPTVRREFAARYRQLFGLDVRPGAGDLEDFFIASEGQWAALLVVECEDLRLCDLSRRDAIWKVLLQTGGEPLAGRIHRLGTPRPTLEGFFPFVGSFFNVFSIRWPLALDALRPSELLVTSPYGRLALRWPGEGAEH